MYDELGFGWGWGKSRQVVFVGVFFFQAEDGIRVLTVTGVQSCTLPIYHPGSRREQGSRPSDAISPFVCVCGL